MASGIALFPRNRVGKLHTIDIPRLRRCSLTVSSLHCQHENYLNYAVLLDILVVGPAHVDLFRLCQQFAKRTHIGRLHQVMIKRGLARVSVYFVLSVTCHGDEQRR